MARMEYDAEAAEALAELDRATAKYRRLEKARDELHVAIVRAFKAGVRPSDIEKHTPYDRNHNGRIRDAAGIPATRPATVVSKRKADRS